MNRLFLSTPTRNCSLLFVSVFVREISLYTFCTRNLKLLSIFSDVSTRGFCSTRAVTYFRACAVTCWVLQLPLSQFDRSVDIHVAQNFPKNVCHSISVRYQRRIPKRTTSLKIDFKLEKNPPLVSFEQSVTRNVCR